jgi:large subunit ribosomal protein L28
MVGLYGWDVTGFLYAVPVVRPIEELLAVASVCDVCGKGPGFGMSVSHSHRRTRRRWNPNIQRVRALIGKTPKRLNVCTSCIRAGKVQRAG